MRSIINRVVEILHRDFEYSEFQGSCIAIVWGMWLLIPGAHRYPGTIQNLLSTVQDLRLLGLVSLVLGARQFVALIRNNVRHRRTASFWAVLFWIYNFVVVSIQNWRLVPAPLLFLFAIGAAWAYWRLGRLMRTNDQ